MPNRRVFVAGALALIGGATLSASVRAHPVFAPFDNTQFAPILRFGPLISLDTVVTGLTAPNKGVAAPGDREHLYVVDQVGIAWKLNLATGGKTVFLDVSGRLVTLGFLGPNTFDERGFLGLAFHPDFRSNGLVYTYTSEPNGGPPTFPTTLPPGSPADHQNVVAEWQMGAAGAVSRRELLRVDWPQFNHNGGDLAFGPDRLLYFSMGDGGEADDQGVGHLPGGNAQSLSNPLGKILRIDVNGRNSANGQYGIPASNPFVARNGAVKEIFAFGFRNPFRMSFDRKRGDLYVGDVGQNDIEEVDRVVAGGNYGWNLKEGTLFFNPNGDAEGFATLDPVPGRPVPSGLIDPIAQYDTHWEGHSVIAGFLYRGERLHALKGRFIFGDFSRLFNFPGGPHNYGRLLHIDGDSGGPGRLRAIREFHITPSNAPNLAVLGFGEDAEGEIYVMGNVSGIPFGTGGVVLQLVPADHHDDD